MTEAYSNNVQLGANQAIPFNNVSIQKGCTSVLVAPATIQLNRAGVYMVSFNGGFAPTATGTIEIQMYKNGVPQPQAVTRATGTAASISPLGFKTLVQVQENNNPNCCMTSPTLLQFVNTEPGLLDNGNVCVTKIC